MQVVRGNVYKPRDTSFDLCGRGGGLDEKCGSILFFTFDTCIALTNPCHSKSTSNLKRKGHMAANFHYTRVPSTKNKRMHYIGLYISKV